MVSVIIDYFIDKLLKYVILTLDKRKGFSVCSDTVLCFNDAIQLNLMCIERKYDCERIK